MPKNLNLKSRKDLIQTDENYFQNSCIERNLQLMYERKKQLINGSYSSNKVVHNTFLEELSTGINYAVTEMKPIMLMGDYNLDYLKRKEKLRHSFVPYGINITYIIIRVSTRVSGNWKYLLDYIITDLQEVKRVYLSDTRLTTIRGLLFCDLSHHVN